MDATPAAPELDVTDLGVTVVALLVHGRVLTRLESPHLRLARGALEEAVGAELTTWLTARELDGEQVLFLVDVLRRRGLDDVAFRSALSRIVEQAPDATSALRLLGDGCRRRRHWGAALQAYRSWHQLAGRTRNVIDQACSLLNLGALHEDMGGYDEALDCYASRRSLHVALGNRVSAAETLVDIGRMHRHRGADDRAVRCLERATADLEAAGEVSAAVRALLGIATVRRTQGRRREALAAVLRSMHMLGDKPAPGMSAALWEELAALCEEDGLLESAGALHTLSQRDLDASGDREGEAVSLRRLAWVRLLQSRTGEAASHYLASLALSGPTDRTDAEVGSGSVDADARQAAVRLARPLSAQRRMSGDSVRDTMPMAQPLWRARIAGADAVA